MSTNTPNYGYILPDDGESVEIGDLRTNFTAIDQDIKDVNDRFDNDWIDVTADWTLTASTTNPAQGTDGVFKVLMQRLGKTRRMVGVWKMGTPGGATLAVAPVGTLSLNCNRTTDFAALISAVATGLGSGVMNDVSPSLNEYPMTLKNTGNTGILDIWRFINTQNGNRLTGASPVAAWGTGDILQWYAEYKVS